MNLPHPNRFNDEGCRGGANVPVSPSSQEIKPTQDRPISPTIQTPESGPRCGPAAREYARPTKRSFRQGSRHQRQGVALIECMVYIAVVMTILGIGLSLYLKLLGFHRDLDRNATDITRSLKAGELWRADIRSAIGPIESTQSDEGNALVIPTANGSIRYQFDQQTLWRHDGSTKTRRAFLQGLSDCEFIKENRPHLAVWRCEIQLKTKLKTVRIEPKFSFLSVNPSNQKANKG